MAVQHTMEPEHPRRHARLAGVGSTSFHKLEPGAMLGVVGELEHEFPGRSSLVTTLVLVLPTNTPSSGRRFGRY